MSDFSHEIKLAIWYCDNDLVNKVSSLAYKSVSHTEAREAYVGYSEAEDLFYVAIDTFDCCSETHTLVVGTGRYDADSEEWEDVQISDVEHGTRFTESWAEDKNLVEVVDDCFDE